MRIAADIVFDERHVVPRQELDERATLDVRHGGARDLNPATIAPSLSAGQAFLPGKADDVQSAVLGVHRDLASAKIVADGFTLQVHLGQWLVVTVLGSPVAVR